MLKYSICCLCATASTTFILQRHGLPAHTRKPSMPFVQTLPRQRPAASRAARRVPGMDVHPG